MKVDKIKFVSLLLSFFLVHRQTMDSTRQSSQPIHRPFHHVIRRADHLLPHAETATHKQDQHTRGVHFKTDTNSSNTGGTNRFLYIHLALHQQWTFVEFGGNTTREYL